MKKAACAPRPDGEATRARILEAAGELFAAHGYAEAASKAIAARAEVDLASINYHFGSRSGFYQAVLAEAHRRLMDVADLQRLAQSRLAATDKLRAVIGHLVGNALSGAENWHISVLTAEILAPSSHIQVLFESEIPRKIAVVMAIASDISGIPQDDPRCNAACSASSRPACCCRSAGAAFPASAGDTANARRDAGGPPEPLRDRRAGSHRPRLRRQRAHPPQEEIAADAGDDPDSELNICSHQRRYGCIVRRRYRTTPCAAAAPRADSASATRRPTCCPRAPA